MNKITISNKIISRIVIIAGLILVTLGSAILINHSVDNLFLSVISFWKGRPPAPQWMGKLHSIGYGILVAGAAFICLFILSIWDRIKQNKVVRIMTPIGAVILIWMTIIIKMFSFGFMGNEADVLPSIKQAVDHTWLPNDWYLNLDITYRQVFDFIFGQLVSKFGFLNGAYIGRLIVYFLVAIAIYVFFRALHLRFSYGLLALLFFLNYQSLIAGEWIVGGLETKTIAYAMAILSFSFFLRKRYLTGFAFAGAAISFHVLVGGYALFCILVASLLNDSWRSEWRLYIKNLWLLIVTGIFGFWTIIDQLIPQGGVDQNKAWNIYVQIRVPNHVLPSAWNGYLWMAELVLATGFFIIMYFNPTLKTTRFTAAFALGSIFLFLVGLVIYILGNIPLQRFYWFRFPDVMIPLLSSVLVALLLTDHPDESAIKNSFFQRILPGLKTMQRFLQPAIIVVVIVILAQQAYRLQESYKNPYNESGRILPAFEWISRNTPKQALFLVDPTESYFYINAQRAMLVSFKHSPQSAAAILEWYKRIKLCNGNVDLAKGNNAISSQGLHINFYKLDETQIQQIANLYGINYYMGLADQGLTFKRVYSDSIYAIYKIK